MGSLGFEAGGERDAVESFSRAQIFQMLLKLERAYLIRMNGGAARLCHTSICGWADILYIGKNLLSSPDAQKRRHDNRARKGTGAAELESRWSPNAKFWALASNWRPNLTV
jgi:hypothetical protein